MRNNQIAIIGGGSAGLFASIIAARLGLKVSVYEKNTKLARKLNITGKGRCNITNISDKETFLRIFVAMVSFFIRPMLNLIIGIRWIFLRIWAWH